MQKKICLLICVVLMFSFFNTFAFAYTYPEYIKIGLFYDKTIAGELSVGFNSTIDIGFQDSTGVFYNMFTTDTIKQITFKKLSQFYVKSPQCYDTYAQANARADVLRNSSIKACVTCDVDSGYYVWLGEYNSDDDAKQNINKISATFPDNYSVIPSNVIAVTLSNGNSFPFCIFVQPTDRYVYCRTSPDVGRIKINNVEYRGNLTIKRLPNSDMTVINEVKFDEYLYSVLGGEMSSSWNIEALKAQAVTSRSFALVNWNKFKRFGFNLDNTTNSQVYFGTSKEASSTIQAVNDTKGVVALYNKKPAETIFFAISGGKTEDVSKVWGGDYVPYLGGINDVYENTEAIKNTRAIWKVELTASKAKQILASMGINIGDILDIQVVERTASSRVYKLKFIGTQGEYILEREKTRFPFGLNSQMYNVYKKGVSPKNNISKFLDLLDNRDVKLSGSNAKTSSLTIKALTLNSKSQYYTPYNGELTFIFDGKGWGHGVGLSQYGAKNMAEKGFAYDKIMTYYFPGITFE